MFLSGNWAQKTESQTGINIEQLLLQADPVSIERLLNEAVEASNAEEQAVVSVKQSNSVEISNKRPRLFRPKNLRSKEQESLRKTLRTLRKRPKIAISSTLAPEPLTATRATEKPSRSSLFSSPRRRFRPRSRTQINSKSEETVTSTQAPSEGNSPRRFPGFIRRPRPRVNIPSRSTTLTTTTTTTTTTTVPTTTTTTNPPVTENELLEFDISNEEPSFEGFFPTLRTLLPTTTSTTPQPIFLQTFGPALPPQPQRSKSSFRSQNRNQNRIRARPNKNRGRSRQQVVELIPVEKQPIQVVEKPRSLPVQRLRPAASQRQRQQPALVRPPPPPPTERPINVPIRQFPQFQFPLSSNPTSSFFEDIPFENAATPTLITDPEVEEEEIIVPVVTPAPTRRIVDLPRKFSAAPVSNQNRLENPDRIKTLDRYSHKNEDGSFTWGYQSSDGSFKEETIGVDCVTKGR